MNFLHHAIKSAPEDSNVLLNIGEFESQHANLSTLSEGEVNPCSKQNSPQSEFNESWGLSPLCSVRQSCRSNEYSFVKFTFTVTDFRPESDESCFMDFARTINVPEESLPSYDLGLSISKQILE